MAAPMRGIIAGEAEAAVSAMVFEEAVKASLLICAEFSAWCHRTASREADGAKSPKTKRNERQAPEQPGMTVDGRLQQHELAETRHQERFDRIVAVARDDALAHERPKITGKLRIGFVDRLVLADKTTKFGGERAGARLIGRIGEKFAWLNRKACSGKQRKRDQRRDDGPHDADHVVAAPATGLMRRARAGAPIRRRRSISESNPPSAMATGPSQISKTKGFQ